VVDRDGSSSGGGCLHGWGAGHVLCFGVVFLFLFLFLFLRERQAALANTPSLISGGADGVSQNGGNL